jgi:transposase-like protein
MEQAPRGVYTQEFREQAVKLVEVEGLSSSLSIREAARRLSIPPGCLKNWVQAARPGACRPAWAWCPCPCRSASPSVGPSGP